MPDENNTTETGPATVPGPPVFAGVDPAERDSEGERQLPGMPDEPLDIGDPRPALREACTAARVALQRGDNNTACGHLLRIIEKLLD